MKALLLSVLLATSASSKPVAGPHIPNEAELKQRAARYAPVELTADVKALPEAERRALAKLVEAASLFDNLFLRQVWSGNLPLVTSLAREGTPLARAQLHAVLLNKGPWDRLEKSAPFVSGVGAKSDAANFYPADATKANIPSWVKGLPPAQQAQAKDFFTVIRRGTDGKLLLVPYSVEYQDELSQARGLLLEAAALTQQPSLKTYLTKRAAAFLSNDYYASDVAWMELDASVEPTLGPYEVYEDVWFNQRAAFEAFITVRDDVQTQKLATLSSHLQEIENHLPIDAKFRNPKLGALAPIRVVNNIFCSGDGYRGVQTAAFNLPNDERIVTKMGTKRVMLKNVQEAKFQKVLLPISKIALSVADQKDVSFEAFFTHILMHEMMHGLGPHNITVAGKSSTVRAELEDSYSAIEEAKADISGLYALQSLVDQGVLDKGLERTMYTTFLASSFRSIRFGLDEAHGRGIAVQLNYLLDEGAFTVSKDGRFTVVPGKIKAAVSKLTGEFMTLQATGDRAKAKAMLERLGVVRPEVQSVLARMKSVPVDIEPKFSQALKLVSDFR